MSDLFGPEPMTAITLWQPWACLIEVGAKPYETRHWRPPASLIGQRIAIHAAARPVVTKHSPEVLDDIYDVFGCGWNFSLPRGVVVCTAILASVHRAEDVEPDSFGDYTPGRFAWKLEDVQPILPHVPAKGKQGWWKWESTI